jgi:hypothetical protein
VWHRTLSQETLECNNALLSFAFLTTLREIYSKSFSLLLLTSLDILQIMKLIMKFFIQFCESWSIPLADEEGGEWVKKSNKEN